MCSHLCGIYHSLTILFSNNSLFCLLSQVVYGQVLSDGTSLDYRTNGNVICFIGIEMQPCMQPCLNSLLMMSLGAGA